MANSMLRESKVLLRLLAAENEMRRFIASPDVELSEGICERSLRPGVLASKTFYVLRSKDGGEAFCDNLGVYNTCRLNDVSYFDYSLWLVANVKYRMTQAMNAWHSDPSIFHMPHKTKIAVKADGKEKLQTIDVYDPSNHTMFDNKVALTGLMPYDYARWRKEYT